MFVSARKTVPHRRIASQYEFATDTVLAIEFAQPVQGKRRAGAIAQQPLTSGTVSGLDAHRRIGGEAGIRPKTMRSGFMRASWA